MQSTWWIFSRLQDLTATWYKFRYFASEDSGSWSLSNSFGKQFASVARSQTWDWPSSSLARPTRPVALLTTSLRKSSLLLAIRTRWTGGCWGSWSSSSWPGQRLLRRHTPCRSTLKFLGLRRSQRITYHLQVSCNVDLKVVKVSNQKQKWSFKLQSLVVTKVIHWMTVLFCGGLGFKGHQCGEVSAAALSSMRWHCESDLSERARGSFAHVVGRHEES